MEKSNGEMRQDKTTGQWVIYAPTRRKRPIDFKKTKVEMAQLPDHDPSCPFCPGSESALPPVLLEIPGENGRWLTRVVPNKFPALVPDGDLHRHGHGIHITMAGAGRHEVVIETPFHNRDIGIMPIKEIASVVETYHRRYRDIMQADESMMAIIFRNHGERAGTSLIHPHSQIISAAVVPQTMRWREEQAQRYFDDWGCCVFCAILEQELREANRMIYNNRSFSAFVPFAAEVPFEIWIMPHKHKADFGDVSDQEKEDLADVLSEVLGRLRRKLGDPDYNYMINTSPRYRAQEPQLHWYVQFRPRLTKRAGFEIGSGMSINPSIPEEDAAFLRA
jgi:UDPglucose--hexose-1-phosphate uridylyltransferase